MSKRMTFAAATMLALVSAALPRSAQAAYAVGYVCEINVYSQAPSNMGEFGYLYVALRSEPGCAGNALGYGYITSSGATWGGMLLSEVSLDAMLGRLLDQQQRNRQLGFDKTDQLIITYVKFR
jgi:hypothetical protein